MSDTGPEIGRQFGPYLLRRLLGSGGMGTVYEAQDTVMDRVKTPATEAGYSAKPAWPGACKTRTWSRCTPPARSTGNSTSICA